MEHMSLGLRMAIVILFWGGLFYIFRRPWLLVVGFFILVLNLVLVKGYDS